MTNSPAPAKNASFYVVGGTLRRDAPSYVPRRADAQLYESLRRGEICYVLTPRQMGKSSLMVRTAARLRDEGVRVAVLDLTSLGQNLTPEQWYNGLLERIAHEFGVDNRLEDVWSSYSQLGPLQRWAGALRDVVLPSHSDRQTVIFIDEIDSVRSLPFSTDEFFAGIRELYNRRTHDQELVRLTFCLLGVASPSDLIRDTRTTPFNIGRRIELSDFTEHEAAPLARGLGREGEVGNLLLKRVLYWTGGHPYITQRLCQAVAENPEARDSAAVDRICGEKFLSLRARERDDNLLFVRDRILRSEADAASLLTLYDRICRRRKVQDDPSDPLITTLHLSGITRVEGSQLKIRNRVYAKVFDHDWAISNMPGAELRRQRTAYTKGLRVAALAILPLIVMAGYLIIHLYRQNISLSLSFKTAEPPPFWASFSISSIADSGAGALLVKTGGPHFTVFINDQQYGQTTAEGILLIDRLQADNYAVRVEKPGFQSTSQHARVEAQKVIQLNFKLQPQVKAAAVAATLIRGAPSGSRVTLDGIDVGITSAEGTLTFTAPPGEHMVKIAKEFFFPQESRFLFVPGNTQVVNAALRLDPEAQRWQALESGATLVGVESFLKDYPNGRFSAQARKLSEQIEWNSLKDSGDLVALTNFVSKYPQGVHVADARNVMAALEREQMDFINARNSNDPEQLQAYLRKYPTGHFIKLARAEISKLTAERQRARNGEEEIRSLVSRFADAYERRDAESLRQIWPTLDSKRYAEFKHSFSLASAITMQVSIGRIQLSTDEKSATVAASIDQSYTPRGGKPRTSATQIIFIFTNSNGTWKISEIHSD